MHGPEENRSGSLRDSEIWFDHHTPPFRQTAAPAPGEGSAERYPALSRRWMYAEKHFGCVAEIQLMIVNAMKHSAAFPGSTKEASWRIDYHHGFFHSAEDPREEREFLAWLRQYFDVTGRTSRPTTTRGS